MLPAYLLFPLRRPIPMLFNSWIFVVFFLVVFGLYRHLSHCGQNRLLLVASYAFYGYWDWRFLSLIFLSTVVDYAVANGIDASNVVWRRKSLLAISMVTNLGLLGIFKYYGFFASECVSLLNSLGVSASLPSLQVVLPVGISFYTFQTMSYTIDVYRREIPAERNLLDFMLFVSFFPQLVAGPVERTKKLLPQILNPRVYTPAAFSEGLYHIVIGLFKKVIVADNMAQIVNTIFATSTTELTGAECLLGVYAFAFQIYGDFSGYSSMAQGIARWLGFDLMTNFQMPYFAVSPSDFWRRWHISLSQWLRDYLYISLGGNRFGKWITYRNLLLTMLLGGLWHGAGWTFIAWGSFHGVVLVLSRILQRRPDIKAVGNRSRFSGLRTIASQLVMFHLVCVGWLLFRAENMWQAGDMLRLIATDSSISSFAMAGFGLLAFFAGPLILFEFWLEKRGNLLQLLDSHWLVRGAVYSYCALMLLFFTSPVKHDFIYFQF